MQAAEHFILNLKFNLKYQERGDLICNFEGAGAQAVLLENRLDLTDTSMVFEGLCQRHRCPESGIACLTRPEHERVDIPLHD